LPLEIEEFDKALEKASKNTAAGIDGLSNGFLKKFWHFFRGPLFRYATACLAKGSLTSNFKTAKIRLIPKKGDCSKIKNLRPISLFSCSYKLISRVFAIRLGKYMDRMTQIGQKGYSKTKQCQEVLISIIEGMSRGKASKKKMRVNFFGHKKSF
jgi:hypothetical protein